MKRLISIIITAALLLGVLSAGVFAEANTATDTTFTVDFGTAVDGTNFKSGAYATTGTSGSNWIVNHELMNSTVLDTTNTKVRIQTNGTWSFTQIKYTAPTQTNNPRGQFVVDFTAPSAGEYNVNGLAVLIKNYGKGNVYINGTYIGQIDSYSDTTNTAYPAIPQPLSSVYLYAGEHANTLAILPVDGKMVCLKGIEFTKKNTEGFEVDFGTADETTFATIDNASNYLQATTAGVNWGINSSFTNSAFYNNTNVRVQTSGIYNFTTLTKSGDIVFNFTADSGAGMYDASAIVTQSNSGAADIYINGQKIGCIKAATSNVGTHDGYLTGGHFWANEQQTLSTIYLHGGENANTLTIVPTSSSNVVLKGFGFDKTTVSGDSFELDFGTADEATLSDVNDVFDYFNGETAGYNWKVDADATASGQKDGTEHAPRIQLKVGSSPENTYNFMTIKDRGDLALKFTAPTGAGSYGVSAIVNPMAGGGYGDIYINGKYVGTLDSYDTTAHLWNNTVVTQDLYTAELLAGDYANTLVITPAGTADGTGAYVFMQSFTFDKTTGESSADEISVEKYVTSGLAAVDAISAYMTDGTLVGSDVIESGHVSIGGVYTVTAPDMSEEGYTFLYWAKGTSEKKRIVGYADRLTYNPQEGRTSLIAVYEKADSVANKAEFYNANGELIESNTTGVFPSLPSMAGLRQATGWKCWNDGKVYDGSEAVVPVGTVIYVADYGELSKVFVNGEKYTYGDPVTLTATQENFKGWVKNGELVSTNKTYTFLAYETCTVTEMTGDKEISAKLVKIALDDFTSGDITAVMAEFIGIDNAVEKGIMFDNGTTVSKIAMTGDGNQFTVTADEEGTYTGYAVIKKGNTYTLIEDGEYVRGN